MLSFTQQINRFVEAAVPGAEENHRRGFLQQAAQLLTASPMLAHANIVTACVTGEFLTLQALIKQNPETINQKMAPRQWEPLLYLVFSRFLRFEKERESQFLKCAEFLLQQGANPNAFFISEDERETVLYGAAGVANNAALLKMLLDAGADPDDGEVHYHVAEFDNTECFRILAEAGIGENARATILLRKLDYEDPGGIRYLLDLGFEPDNRGIWGKTALHQALMRGRSREIIQMLLDAGSDVNAQTKDGQSALAIAVREGRQDIADLLLQYGAEDNLSINDRFIGACMRADRSAVQAIRVNYPLVINNLTNEDKSTVTVAASQGNDEAVELMLEAGIPANVRDSNGATALHWAAWCARPLATRILLKAGASVSVLDNEHNCTPLEWALRASMESDDDQSDYQQVVEQLLEAGAERSDKYPGSNAVQEVLRRFAASGG